MTKKDKYGRELKTVLIRGRQYQILDERAKPTKAIRGPGGRFLGRYSGVNDPDMTRYVRIKQEIDVNNDRIPDLKKGQIVGRISRYYRGPLPNQLKVRVYISNKRSAAAMKETQRQKFKKIRRRSRKK